MYWHQNAVAQWWKIEIKMTKANKNGKCLFFPITDDIQYVQIVGPILKSSQKTQ